MKFKSYLALITTPDGFIPTGHFRWEIRKNPRKTAREEAIAAKILEEANPRENVTGHFPWGAEEQMVLQQFWIHPQAEAAEWRDVPIKGAGDLYSVVPTKHGDLPIPNCVREPGMVQGNFGEKIKEILGEDIDDVKEPGMVRGEFGQRLREGLWEDHEGTGGM